MANADIQADCPSITIQKLQFIRHADVSRLN